MARKQSGAAQVERAAEARAERYADATDDPSSVLSGRQIEAARLIAEGNTDAEVAEAIGVDALTVLRWRTKHPTFRALVNRASADQLDRPVRALDDPDDGVRAALRYTLGI